MVLKLLSKKQTLKWIKGHNSVANLRKTIIYNTDVDIVNDDVFPIITLSVTMETCVRI